MKNIDYDRAIAEYDLDLQRLMLDYKNTYDEDERKEIFKLCRKITRIGIPYTDDSLKSSKVEIFRPFFLKSLTVFENSNLSDYFRDKTENITVIRDRKQETGEANLEYDFSIYDSTRYRIYLPQKGLTFSDLMSYFHEVGHIPEIDLVRKSYLEYSEVLPLFMEYLAELKSHDDQDEALDYFLLERLPDEKLEAAAILKIYKKVEHRNPKIRLYNAQQFADYYKYLESLDFVIQLIDIMNEDKKEVGKEIESVSLGKSLVETAKDFHIETTGCKRLLKEYKRISRL